MDIAIIRHLPTAWNVKGKLQGQKDIPIILPISHEMETKISENKQKLKTLAPFDIILTSELSRTKQTAKLYGYENTTVEPLLNELDFGDFEGESKRELEAIPEWKASPLEVSLGESLVQFQNRIAAFLQKYAHCTSILIFGHGSWIRGLLSMKEIGTINKMNELTVQNNELIILKNFELNLINSARSAYTQYR